MKTQKNPYKAFILAAGFGTRLRPYTDDRPKPMVEVNGRSLIYRTLDKLRAAKISEVVVNAHYKADVLAQHLNDYAAQHGDIIIHISRESDILDTGGGVKNALHYFDNKPFYVIAGDNLWEDGEIPALERLVKGWDSNKMDILTLMQPLESMKLTGGVGDYDLLENGLVRRSLDKSGAYMWSNIRLNHPLIYEDIEGKSFSFLDIMDKYEAQKRFSALVHDGNWHHISTPKDLETVDEYYKKNENS